MVHFSIDGNFLANRFEKKFFVQLMIVEEIQKEKNKYAC